MAELKTIMRWVQNRIEVDAVRNREVFEKQEAAYFMEWDLPAAMQRVAGMRASKSSRVHDAIRTGTNILSGHHVRYQITPPHNNEGTKKNFEHLEQALMWMWRQGSQRGRAKAQRGLGEAAFLYDMNAMQVTFIPQEIKEQKAMGADEDTILRLENALEEGGPFTFTAHNPKDVHAAFDQYGLKWVALDKIMPAHEVVSNWGGRADELAKWLDDNPEMYNDEVRYLDYQSATQRAVWVLTDTNALSVLSDQITDVGKVNTMHGTQGGGGAGQAVTHATFVIIDPEEDKKETKFLDWVVVTGATDLHHDPKRSLHPLGKASIDAGTWEEENIVRSADISELIATAANPNMIREGPDPESIEYNYDELGGTVDVPPGHNVQPLPAPRYDERKGVHQNRLAEDQQRQMLQPSLGGETSASSFASHNLQIQTSLSQITPFREVVEFCLAGVAKVMVRWLKHHNKDIYAYGFEAQFVGEQILLTPDTLPTTLNVKALIEPDVAIDKLQRTNEALMQVQGRISSRQTAMEKVGHTNTSHEKELIENETLEEQVIQEEAARRQAEMQLEMQQKAQQQQQQAQEQAIAQQQQAQQAQQGPPPGALQPPQPPQFQGGIGLAGNLGGGSANELNPQGVLRESVNGVDRQGNEVLQ